MATLQGRNGSYRVILRFGGRQHTVPVGKASLAEAEALLGKVEHLLLRIKQRWVQPPPGITITEFILADGQVKAPEQAAGPAEPVTFRRFKEKYLATQRIGAMEPNSLATAAMHLNHFERTLGEGFLLNRLALADLQRHVNGRAKKHYRGKPLSPVSLRKEAATFRAAWHWAAANGLVAGPFPSKGLV
jgi:hypothetical protein